MSLDFLFAFCRGLWDVLTPAVRELLQIVFFLFSQFFFFFLSSSLLFFLWGLFAFLSSVNWGEAEPWGKFPVSFGKMCGKGEVRVRARPGYPAWLPGALAWVPQRLRSHLERQSGKGVTSLLR